MLNTMALRPDRIIAELVAKLHGPEIAATITDIEAKLTQFRRDQRMQSGAFRGTYVTVYRGYVADDVAYVRVRVTEAPELPGESIVPYWAIIQTNLLRHAALDIVGADVELTIGRHSVSGVSDNHGFVEFELPVPGLSAGWHEVEATATVDGEWTTGTGRVVKPSTKAPFLVISDIDDTILVTGLTEGVAMVTRTLMRDANQRTATKGMSSLYRGLCRGVSSRSGGRKPEPTFFYVSTGSWAFYHPLQQFIQLRAFPQGPMFLTDWGPTEHKIRRSGAEHKLSTIRRLLKAYPDKQFVLIGDSGQRDPLTYEEIAREFPERIQLIIIRQVGRDDETRNRRVRDRAAELRGESIPFHLASDAIQAAELANALGLCDAETIDEVRTEIGPL
jgi:phosphatidate phosphatase APP1